jgi:hypothetical protein
LIFGRKILNFKHQVPGSGNLGHGKREKILCKKLKIKKGKNWGKIGGKNYRMKNFSLKFPWAVFL